MTTGNALFVACFTDFPFCPSIKKTTGIENSAIKVDKKRIKTTTIMKSNGRNAPITSL
jgi:hypothetical protein